MDIARAQETLAHRHRAVLATARADGSPQLSPVLVALDASGTPVISTRAPAYKVRNVRRDPRVSLCVLPDEFFGDWMQLDGTADIVELPEAMDGLIEYYRTISGEHPNWDEYREAMRSEQRVLLRITPTRAGPDRAG
ncbi:PPOX class F420-dependent oxidoreductase [Haloechinothrix salitolerans]|uniref:PPOX class F420-dependent oxidoreductase n=1 Tax=Haloechinothrix salitolerans TaxID=926830 RepID=A0ABW2C1J1_9PSEU